MQKPKQSLTVLRGFYIPVEDMERLISYSDQTGKGRSQIVREALKKRLDEMEETGEVSPIKKRVNSLRHWQNLQEDERSLLGG